MSFFKDIFSSPGNNDPEAKKTIPPEEEAVLEMVAKKVVAWRMAVPAILFLESVKPLNYIGSQMMVFFEPIMSIFSIKEYNNFRLAMERRENVENLLKKIEKYDAAAYRREKLYRKKLRQERKKWTWYQRYLGIKRPQIKLDPDELKALEDKANNPGNE